MQNIRIMIVGMALLFAEFSLHGAQYIMWNGTYSYDPTDHEPAAIVYAKPEPANWLTPDNYKDGTIYVRMEVTGKANDSHIVMMLGFWEYSKGWCDGCFSEYWAYNPDCAGPSRGNWLSANPKWGMDIYGNGVYWAKFIRWDYIYGPEATWTDPVTLMNWGAWCESIGNYLQTQYLPSEALQPYMPFTLNIQVVHVSSGSMLAIPDEFGSAWNDCPAGWNAIATDVKPKSSHAAEEIENGAVDIDMSRTRNAVSVHVPLACAYELCILQADGKTVTTLRGSEPADYTFTRRDFKPRLYFVEIAGGGHKGLKPMMIY